MKKKSEREEIVPKEFRPEEVGPAITKLQRRIAEVKQLASDAVNVDDPRRDVAESNIRSTILEVFGPNSPEFRQHGYYRIWEGSLSFNMPDYLRQKGFADGIPHAIAMLEGFVGRLEEKQADLVASPQIQAFTVFQGLKLHQRIADAAQELFRDGHYPEAIFNASKALIHFVQEKSGRYDLDGAPLMRGVFSANTPTILFSAETDPLFHDEQEGFMHLFEGMALAIRNPRAHSFRVDTAERALEYLSFLSLLANRLQEAVKK